MTLSKGKLFDPVLVTDLINKVAGRSSLAKLSQQVPIPFNGQKEFIFTMDSDIDIVAENGAKSHGGITIEPVTIIPLKVEYGARISDEYMTADEEEKIKTLESFNDGFAKKVARGIDLMAIHGINPRTGKASDIIGKNCFDQKVNQTVEFKGDNPEAAIEVATSLVQGSDGIISGMALDTSFSSELSSYQVNGIKQFPELAWGANPETIRGIKSDINNTVSAGTTDLAVIGDFSEMFKWGYSKEIILETIEYGDPDNSGKDLKGHNQVYLRAESFLGWGIMDGNSFARVIKASEVPGGE